jgi:hypothetical protein
MLEQVSGASDSMPRVLDSFKHLSTAKPPRFAPSTFDSNNA